MKGLINLLSCSFILGLFFVALPVAQAEIVKVQAEGCYTVADGFKEGFDEARKRARDEARRMAAEKAGIIIRSSSRTENNILTHDEVISYSSHFMKVRHEKMKMEPCGDKAITFICQISAEVDTANLDINKIVASRETIVPAKDSVEARADRRSKKASDEPPPLKLRFNNRKTAPKLQ